VITLAAIQTLIAQGESETLELKRSTAELRRAGETLCAFLNGDGGKVLIGVRPDGKLVGQEVADITLRDIAAMLGRFEPPARVEMSRVDVGNARQVIVLEAAPSRQFAPFVFESKPYKRVGSTTTVMTQEEYARLLLDRSHSRHRWENQPAAGVRLEGLDREEILRTRATAIEQRRLSAGTSMDVGDILDRLGLRIDGQVTRAAQMLYGTKFLPDYPQALLKLGRFRGTKITGDILDNKQDYLHAFAMVREAIAWLDRTLPLSARFPKGAINREDRLPVPAEALREIVINAVIHRDVSNPSSYRSSSCASTCRSDATRSSPKPSIARARSRRGGEARTASSRLAARMAFPTRSSSPRPALSRSRSRPRSLPGRVTWCPAGTKSAPSRH
jgi:ATP-dependent DNA helicase RecG